MTLVAQGIAGPARHAEEPSQLADRSSSLELSVSPLSLLEIYTINELRVAVRPSNLESSMESSNESGVDSDELRDEFPSTLPNFGSQE